MTIDWKKVKKETLWSYEELIDKLERVLAYPFVQEYYNHSMRQAQLYAREIREGYLQNQGPKVAWIDGLIERFAALEARGEKSYATLVEHVATREQCCAYLQQGGIEFGQLIQVLHYLFRWVLPFRVPLRQIASTERVDDAKWLSALAKQGIRSNLDLLEAGRTKAGGVRLSRATGVPAPQILALVHRADISRLAYVRGKTVNHLCGGGYDTLEKIAAAGLEEMEQRMDGYYRTLGKSLADFKLVIPLTWMIGGAKILPRVVRQ